MILGCSQAVFHFSVDMLNWNPLACILFMVHCILICDLSIHRRQLVLNDTYFVFIHITECNS
jgi:hypothetical protein